MKEKKTTKKTFRDKGQNCYDGDFSGALLHTNDKWTHRWDSDS